MKSDIPDTELTLYQLHCRYVRLAGLSLEEAAKLWNEMKDSYATREAHMEALLARLPDTSAGDADGELEAWGEQVAAEGDEIAVEVKRRMREARMVRCRLELDSFRCQACGFKAPQVVNEAGDVVDLDATVVEVHHIAPLADGTRTTQLQDLVTLCPNCHRTVHAVAKTLGHKDAALDLLKHCTS